MTEPLRRDHDSPWSAPPRDAAPPSVYWGDDPAEARAESTVAAILTDDGTSEANATVDLSLLPQGGPHFVGTKTASTAIVPNGVATPKAHEPGTFRSAWSIPTPKTRRTTKRSRGLAAKLLVLAILVAGADLAYPRVHELIVARSVPAELRGYVEGKGVRVTAPMQGYSVRLPKQPVRRDVQLTSTTHVLSMVTHWSIASDGKYQIVVWEGDLPGPRNSIFPEGLLGALADQRIGGAGVFTRVHRAELAGEAAYVADLRAPNSVPMRVAVLIHGARLYVIRVQSKSVGPVFDAVTHSFRLTS